MLDRKSGKMVFPPKGEDILRFDSLAQYIDEVSAYVESGLHKNHWGSERWLSSYDNT